MVNGTARRRRKPIVASGVLGAAFDPVGGEIADEDGWGGWGEESVGEEVHGNQFSSPGAKFCCAACLTRNTWTEFAMTV